MRVAYSCIVFNSELLYGSDYCSWCAIFTTAPHTYRHQGHPSSPIDWNAAAAVAAAGCNQQSRFQQQLENMPTALDGQRQRHMTCSPDDLPKKRNTHLTLILQKLLSI